MGKHKNRKRVFSFCHYQPVISQKDCVLDRIG
uniref:Uncharacterized protein n=1 Tax=Rhizophora mucronata TaxID=61149 RepID=A0A2P2R0H3_RHIMU